MAKNAVEVVCSRCGMEFLSRSEFKDEEPLCLACRVKEDMKLPSDTLINQNIVSIWMNRRYDPAKGIDRSYLMAAEGVYLVEKRKRPSEQLCSTITFIGTKDNTQIDSYLKNVRNRPDIRLKYDALVFLKLSSKSPFRVFGISFSDRMIAKLEEKTEVFKKQYVINLAIKWYALNYLKG